LFVTEEWEEGHGGEGGESRVQGSGFRGIRKQETGIREQETGNCLGGEGPLPTSRYLFPVSFSLQFLNPAP
jgi:hypothetical protein